MPPYSKLEASKLNFYSAPQYDLLAALKEIDVEGGWLREALYDAYEAAWKRYEKEHPLEWDNERQRSYRKGINDTATGS